MAEENDTRIEDDSSVKSDDSTAGISELFIVSENTDPSPHIDCESSEQATPWQSTQQQSLQTQGCCRAKDNKIVIKVSECYKTYFGNSNAEKISDEVIAALVLEVCIDREPNYEIVILTAGCKYITSMCNFEKRPSVENYCWDICDGHAEAVCLRLAFVYFLSEMSKALENACAPLSAGESASSIFTYEENTGYHLKQNVQFHLFVSHPPCGFMTESSFPLLSWKTFTAKPHILECSSKILISAYLGIQGPLICWLPKPIQLASVVILENQNFKRQTPMSTVDIINKHFDDFKVTVENYEKFYVSEKKRKDLIGWLYSKVHHSEKEHLSSEEKKIINEEVDIDETVALSEVNLSNCYKKPHIQLVKTSSKENEDLFINNPLLVSNNQKSKVPCYFALPGTPISREGHTFEFLATKDGTFDRCDIFAEVSRYYSKLRSIPLCTQHNQENFKNAMRLLEKALPIQESIKKMLEIVCNSIDFNDVLVYMTKMLPVYEHTKLLTKFNQSKTKRNIDIAQLLQQVISENEDKQKKCLPPSYPQAVDTLYQILEKINTIRILKGLENRDSSFSSITDIDCDWHRHLEIMNKMQDYFVHEQAMGNAELTSSSS